MTLEREKDHWQRRYLEAERHRTELLILIGLMRDDAAATVARLRADGYRVVKLEQGEGDPDCTWGHLIVTEELT